MRTVGRRQLAVGSVLIVVLIGLIVFSAGCGSKAVEKAAVQPVKVSTPIPPEAEPISTPVNVSFSTYSKDWPVGWQWIDPEEDKAPTAHDVKGGVLRIRAGQNRDLQGENRSAPRYLKPISGDFQIETRVKFNPTENYQGAGLLLYADEKNYLRFERAYGGPGRGTSGIRVHLRTPADERTLVSTEDLPTSLPQIDLKLVRQGPKITAFWREDDEAEWREAANFQINLAPSVLAGIVVCNTAREAYAEFQYIRLLPAPKP